MRTFLIIITATAVYVAGSFYIGLRGYQYIGSYIPFLSAQVYWSFFWLFSFSLILGRLPLPQTLKRAFLNAGAWWMAVAVYSLLLFSVADLGMFLVKAAGVKSLLSGNIRLYTGMLPGLLLTGLIVYGALNATRLSVSEYNIKIAKKAGDLESLHIVLISDLHLGEIVTCSRLSIIVDKVNALKPDIVLITGDITDDDLRPYISQNMPEAFCKLKSTYGSFGILGNHDGYGADLNRVTEQFELSGIHMLRDSYSLVDGSFYVTGRDYAHKSRGRQTGKPLSDIMAGMDKRYPVILLNHEPTNLEESRQQGVDLQVSGHTHAGQLFPFNFITKMVFEQDWGYLRKDSFQLIVTSGAATWGPPVRLGTRSEIVSIRVRFEFGENNHVL